MSEDIVKESIKCLANMEIKETTYQVARSVVLDEIERLNKEIKRIELDDSLYIAQKDDEIRELKEEIERLHSIIKEVREYIENGNYRFREGTDICLYQEGNEVFYMENDELMARKILSILDKENKLC